MTRRHNRPAGLGPKWKFIGRLASVICLLLLEAPRSLGSDADVRASFLREYGPYARELQRFYGHGEAECIETQYFPKGGQSSDRCKAKWSGPNFLVFPEKRATIYGGNTQYEFSLESKGSDSYALTDLTMKQPYKPTGYRFFSAPFADYLFSQRTYLEMGAEDRIEFLEFQDGLWQAKPVKRLKIRLNHNFGTDPQKTTERFVTFYFSPSSRWLCQGTQCQEVKAPAVQREERYFYDSGESQSLPALKRWEMWGADRKDPSKLIKVIDREITEFHSHTAFPQSDFTLSAFGLPEPYGVVWKTPTPWYLWFIGSGIAFLAVGWYLRRRVRRRTTMIAPPPPSPVG